VKACIQHWPLLLLLLLSILLLLLLLPLLLLPLLLLLLPPQGGISNGEDIVIKVAFKPTSTIGIKQQTVTREGARSLQQVPSHALNCCKHYPSVQRGCRIYVRHCRVCRAWVADAA
jgi:hypothetical protein